MVTDKNENWPVSKTGGKIITGYEAAKILHVSYSQMYKLIDRGVIMRAKRRIPMFRKQPLVFFLQDVVDLALEYEVITTEEAERLLHPNGAAAIVAA